MIENIIIFAFLIFVNFIFYKNLNKLSKIIDIYDQPNKDRKIHSSQVPILGGIIFFINIFTYLIYEKFFLDNITFSLEVSNLAIVLFLTFLIGIIDDKKDLNQNLKFLFFLILFSFFFMLKMSY